VPFRSPEPGIGHTFGMGFIGNDVFGAGNISPWTYKNATSCLTPANGNKMCTTTAGSLIMGNFIGGPIGGLLTDTVVSGANKFPGNNFYAATPGAVTRVSNVTSVSNLTLSTQYGGTFCFITGLTLDLVDLANETLYVGSDCTQGGINGAGAIWQVQPQAPAPGPPATPATPIATSAKVVNALAGSANVSWTPSFNGQTTKSYVVRTVLASNGTTLAVPDTHVGPPAGSSVVPTSTIVSGLAFGTAVQFQVEACNSSGCSPFSGLSLVFTPQAVTVPGAPTNVSALPGNKSAAVAWAAPLSNGGSSITSYTVSAFDSLN